MTQIISENLYLSLVKNRDEQIAKINSEELEIADITAEIASDEQFITNYDAIIAGFEDTIASLNSQIESIEASLATSEETLASKKNLLETAEADLQGLQETLSEVQETGTPQQIAAAQAAVDAKQAEVSELQDTIATLEDQIKNLKSQEESAKASKEDANKDKDDAIGRRGELVDEGGLQNKKDALQELKDSNAASQAEYNAWIATNGPLITSFEKQQGFRDQVILSTTNRNNYNRLRSSNLNDLINQENTTVQQVIETDLDEENLTVTEKELRTAALEKGRDSAVNPDYLDRDQAAELARGARFSTSEVASKIKAAALNGDFSVSVPRLADTTIYALQEAKYNVYLTSQSNDALFKIDWSNVDSGN